MEESPTWPRRFADRRRPRRPGLGWDRPAATSSRTAGRSPGPRRSRPSLHARQLFLAHSSRRTLAQPRSSAGSGQHRVPSTSTARRCSGLILVAASSFRIMACSLGGRHCISHKLYPRHRKRARQRRLPSNVPGHARYGQDVVHLVRVYPFVRHPDLAGVLGGRSPALPLDDVA